MDVLIKPAIKYDCAEWTQATVTDYDVSAQALFDNCNEPTKIIIRSDQTMTVRFNGTGAASPAITVAANTAFELDIRMTAVYITTTTSTAVKIILLQSDVS